MIKIQFIILILIITASCQQKEEPKPAYQFPSGPIQSADSLQLMRKAVEEEPGNVNGWIKLGNYLMDTSQFTDAIEAYQKALDIDPQNVDVRVDMGTCYRRAGQPDRAVEAYGHALRINPNHLYAHMNLGIVLAYDLNNNDEAIKAFEKYLELYPAAPNAEQVRAEIKRLTEQLKNR